jgi:hypothetical protein
MRAVLIRQVAYFPLRECRINEDWKESRMASITFARHRPDGRVAIAAFIVDLGCLGIKSAFANPAITVSEYESRLVYGQATKQIRCDPAFAVKLIQGAYEYAKQLGFSPDPDYYYSREIFGSIDPASCPETIEYGKDGKPFYFAGPYDDVDKIMDHLTQKLGPNGFHFVVPVGPQSGFDLLDEEDEEEDWDEDDE